MKKYYERRWLNKKEGRAYSICKIETFGSKDIDVGVEIGDCSRSINLDFYYTTEKEKRTMQNKLDNLIVSLQKLRKAMDS